MNVESAASIHRQAAIEQVAAGPKKSFEPIRHQVAAEALQRADSALQGIRVFDSGDPDAWHPVVAAPARNEVQRLPVLLAALAAQTWVARTGRQLPVTLVLNNCTDGSLDAVRLAERRYPALAFNIVDVMWTADAHVGRARRMAMDFAMRQAPSGAGLVLLTTDADAQPEPDWVDATLQAMAAGADAVGGLIIGDPAEEAQLGPEFLRRAALQMRYTTLVDQLASLIDPLPYDPWPRHHDHTGASLAVRGDVYTAIGGLPPLPFREDLALVRRIRTGGYRLVHPLDVRVGVSARLDGRAPGGMADCLKTWVREEADGRPHLVEAPEDIRVRFETRRALRDGSLGEHARIERWAADNPDAVCVLPVETAIAQLGRMIAEMDAVADAG